jgi:hypothetical protein
MVNLDVAATMRATEVRGKPCCRAACQSGGMTCGWRMIGAGNCTCGDQALERFQADRTRSKRSIALSAQATLSASPNPVRLMLV